MQIVLISMQDRCLPWDKHTIGSEIIRVNDGTPGDVGQMEARCGLF
jgi:hypothetical protein